MNRRSRIIILSFVMGLVVSGSLVAQTPTEISQSPITIQPTSAINPDQPIEITVDSLSDVPQTEVQVLVPERENPYLSDDPTPLLPMLSDMLNQGAEERAKASLERLHRKAMIRTSESITSEFLSVETAKQSS